MKHLHIDQFYSHTFKLLFSNSTDISNLFRKLWMLHFQFRSLQGFLSTSVVQGIFSPSISVSRQLRHTYAVGAMPLVSNFPYAFSPTSNVFPEAMWGRLDGRIQIVLISWSQVSGNILAMLIQSEIYFFYLYQFIP